MAGEALRPGEMVSLFCVNGHEWFGTAERYAGDSWRPCDVDYYCPTCDRMYLYGWSVKRDWEQIRGKLAEGSEIR